MNDSQRPTSVPLKIACVIHSLSGGGAERVMATLASRLAERDHDVTLLTLDAGAEDRHEVGESVKQLPLDLVRESGSLLGRVLNHRRRVRSMRGIFKSISPDVILSFCDRTNIDVLLAARGLKIPIIVSERSDPNQQSLGGFWEWMRKRTYRRAASVIALTDTSAEFLRRISQNVIVIPSAVARPPIRSSRKFAADAALVVGVGRLEHEKGFDRLIKAFAAATESHPDWRLKVLGEGSLRNQLEELTRELKIAHRVSMPGWARPIWEPLSEATFFCLSSRYEGFPSALLESMAMAVPSLSVDCPSGSREIIRDDDNGRLCENSIASLTDAIKEMIEQREQRERLGVRATEVVQRFSWDKMVRAYEGALAGVVEK